MTKLINEFPKRIIRVDNCSECPYCQEFEFEYYECSDIHIDIGKYKFEETLPDNCPLEKVVQIIKYADED